MFSPSGCPLQCKRQSIRDGTAVLIRAHCSAQYYDEERDKHDTQIERNLT